MSYLNPPSDRQDVDLNADWAAEQRAEARYRDEEYKREERCTLWQDFEQVEFSGRKPAKTAMQQNLSFDGEVA